MAKKSKDKTKSGAKANKSKASKEVKGKKSKDVVSLVADAENALASFEMQSASVDFVDEVFATQKISIRDFDNEMAAAAVSADDEDDAAEEAVSIDEEVADAAADSNDSEIETILGTEAELDNFDAAEIDGDDDDQDENDLDAQGSLDGLEGTELAGFASAEIEDVEELPIEKIASILESLLFASDKPQSVAMLKAAFVGTKVKSADIRKALQVLEVLYTNPDRGVELYEISGGYQLRTKSENAPYMQRTIKARPFRLSGPALEVLSIVAYKQPCAKVQVDEIRGVESGHLMRGLLERGLIAFGEKSELPGRPMYYETTKKFLEIFGLRQIEELPTLNEIDQLIPEGIGEAPEEKKTLSDVTQEMSQNAGTTYSEGEEELQSISSDLQNINLSTAFFEEEKKRARDKKDLEKAQEIRERQVIGEEISTRERNWLEKYDNGTLYVAKEFPKEKFAKASADGEVSNVAPEAVVTEGADADVASMQAATSEPDTVMSAVTMDESAEDIEDAIIEAEEPTVPASNDDDQELDPLEQALQSLRSDNSDDKEPESEV